MSMRRKMALPLNNLNGVACGSTNLGLVVKALLIGKITKIVMSTLRLTARTLVDVIKFQYLAR